MARFTSTASGFLSAEETDDGWVFLYEPQGDDFGGLPGERPTTSSKQLHEKLTAPRGTGKPTSSSRDGSVEDIPREPISDNNDRSRAGRYIEKGVYRIAVTDAEIEEYRRILSGMSPMLGHVVSQTKSMTIAQDVAIAKMIQLARYMDPSHEVDEHPNGVVLELSDMEALHRMNAEIREGREAFFHRVFAEAMGREDWLEHVKANEGHPIKPTRKVPEPGRKDYYGIDRMGNEAFGFSRAF